MLAQSYMHSEVAAYLIECAQLTRALARRLQRTPTQSQVHDALFKEVGADFRDHELARILDDGSRMIAAAREGDLFNVRRAVESGEVDVNTIDISTGETAFSASLAEGRHKVCDYLMENGAHAYAPCIVGGKIQSALVTAVQNGDAEFVRRLLAHGVHFLVTHDLSTCALREAVNGGSDEMLCALLDGGAYFQRVQGPGLPDIVVDALGAKRFNAEDRQIWQRLSVACWQQDLRRIRHLFMTCEQLQDREMVAAKAADALFLAVYRGNERVVTELLAQGADINSRGERRLTAIDAALNIDSLRMLRFVQGLGATRTGIEAIAVRRFPTLFSAAICARAAECAKFLLPLETAPIDHDQALDLAIQQGDEDLVRLLLDRALPAIITFLWYVGSATSPTILDLLLTRGCAERYPITSLINTFQNACTNQRMDLLAVYLAHGVDVNARGMSNVSLIHAVSPGRAFGCPVSDPGVIRLLLDHGADLFALDQHGHTALDIVEDTLGTTTLSPDGRASFESCRDILRHALGEDGYVEAN